MKTSCQCQGAWLACWDVLIFIIPNFTTENECNKHIWGGTCPFLSAHYSLVKWSLHLPTFQVFKVNEHTHLWPHLLGLMRCSQLLNLSCMLVLRYALKGKLQLNFNKPKYKMNLSGDLYLAFFTDKHNTEEAEQCSCLASLPY